MQVNIRKSPVALELLTRYLEQASGQLKFTKTTEVVNAKAFSTTVINFGEHMKQKMSQLLELVKQNIVIYEKMGHCDDATVKLPDIPSSNPRLCSLTVIYDKRKLLVRKELFQTKLPSYRKFKNIPAGKQTQLSTKWYLIHPYLARSIEKDAAFCFVYTLFQKVTVEEAWSISGVSASYKMKSKRRRGEN